MSEKIKRIVIENDQSLLANSFIAICLSIFLVIFSNIFTLLIPIGNENLLIFSLSQYLFLFLPSYAIIYYLQFSGKLNFLKYIKLNNYHFIVFFAIIILTQLSGFFLSSFFEFILPQEIVNILEEYYRTYEEMFAELVSFNFNNPLLIIFVVAITPAICEEFLFRGYLQSILKKKFSTSRAIIITSIIFSVVHLDFLSFFGIFFLSCVLGYYKEKTNSLKIPMLIHFLNNFFSIILYNSMIFFEFEV